jgi:TRAP-type mannitol/chloroaromatic compound transport system permease large subunit
MMLAGLYVLYVVLLAKLKPHLMPPLTAAERFVPLPALTDADCRDDLEHRTCRRCCVR